MSKALANLPVPRFTGQTRFQGERPLLKRIALVSLALLALLVSCESPQPQKLVVARVGEQEVYFRDFLLRFTLFPHFQDNTSVEQARLQQLAEVVDRFILWRAAEEDGLAKDPEIQAYLNYILQQETLKYLYQKEVWEKIPVTEQALWEEYKRQNIKVRLRHLYAPTLDQARQLRERLEAGESFSALAREVFQDSALVASGGDLGYVMLNQLDPLLADTVFHLPLHKLAGPLESSFGYHIVRVEDVMVNVFTSRQEFEQQKPRLKEQIRQRKMRSAGARYVKRILKGKTVRIKKRALNALLQLSQENGLSVGKESPLWSPAITDFELQQLRGQAGQLLQAPLVIFDGQQWRVQDFLDRLRWIPPLRRPTLNRQRVLARYIINLVRDELLYQYARRKGYHQSPEVKEAVALWRRELLADEFQKRLRWEIYRQQDPQTWQRRWHLYRQLKENTPVQIFEENLFHDVPPDQRQKKQPRIPVVVRSAYVW